MIDFVVETEDNPYQGMTDRLCECGVPAGEEQQRLVHWRHVVHRPPRNWSVSVSVPTESQGRDSLEQQDVWFGLVDLVVLPSQTLP